MLPAQSLPLLRCKYFRSFMLYFKTNVRWCSYLCFLRERCTIELQKNCRTPSPCASTSGFSRPQACSRTSRKRHSNRSRQGNCLREVVAYDTLDRIGFKFCLLAYGTAETYFRIYMFYSYKMLISRKKIRYFPLRNFCLLCYPEM